VLVPEGWEGVRHHLHELERRAIVVVPSLERLYESLKRPTEFLNHARVVIQQAGTEMTDKQRTLTAQRIAPTSRMTAMRSGNSGMPSFA
jgi:hypothetical protein